MNTNPAPRVERDIGAFYFESFGIPKCSKPPIDALISSLRSIGQEDIQIIKDEYETLLPPSTTVSKFPWALKGNCDIAILCITDENCVIEFNTIMIKPGKGEFVILKYMLVYCTVTVLNHEGEMEVKYFCINLPDSYRSDLVQVVLNTTIRGKTYVYTRGTFGSVDEPKRTIIDVDDIPIYRIKTNFVSGTIRDLRVDDLMVDRVARFCHGDNHLLTIDTYPPCKDFVVENDVLDEFLEEVGNILPDARIDGFQSFLHQSIYARPEEATNLMNRKLDILESNIRKIADTGLIRKC